VELLDYIKDLLLKNNYVILPGLGWFSLYYKSAEIYEGRFNPPCKSILFYKELKYNDNILTNFIIQNEGISNTEASNKVSRLVKDIIYRLGEGEKIEIPDIGTLQYDIKGNLCFTEQLKKNFNISSFGMPSFKIEPYTKNVVLGKKSITTKKNLSMIKPIKKKETALKKESHPAKEPIQKKESDSKGMMFLKILLVIAVTIVTALIINKELNKKQENKLPVKEKIIIPARTQDSLYNTKQDSIANTEETEETEEQIVVNKDTISNIIPKSTRSKALKKPKNISSSNASYFIIGGVFKSHGHAVKYIDKIKSKGYTNVLDVNFVRDLHYVTIGQFATLKEAKAAKNKILTEDPKSGIWIYKKH